MKYNPNSLSRKTEGNVKIVRESAPGGMRKIRCPISHQLAAPGRAADGTSVIQAPGGTRYVTKWLK